MIGRTEIEAALAAHGRIVAVAVTDAKGSSPRDAGTIMLVFRGGTLGTIGGGTVEHQCISHAQRLLTHGGAPQRHEFPLGPDLDQCCGGHMTVAIGLVDLATTPAKEASLWSDGPVLSEAAPNRPVIIYGSGHVGQALVRSLAPLQFQVMLVDARADPPDADRVDIATPLPEAVAEEAGPETFHIVLTHSHAMDLEIVSTVLTRPFGFCGLIGSATKRALFERRLYERGFAPEIIANLTCPIGLPVLKDKRPEAIAASVAVQLLLRDQVLRGQA